MTKSVLGEIWAEEKMGSKDLEKGVFLLHHLGEGMSSSKKKRKKRGEKSRSRAKESRRTSEARKEESDSVKI